VVPPPIPQAVQNPAIQGIFAPGNRNTPVPRAAVQAVTLPGNPLVPVLRPPSTGDAGLLHLTNAW